MEAACDLIKLNCIHMKDSELEFLPYVKDCVSFLNCKSYTNKMQVYAMMLPWGLFR